MIKLFEAFSGIGAQTKALKNLNEKFGIEFENIGTSDWDVAANLAYSKLHDERVELSYKESIKLISERKISFDGMSEFENILKLSEKEAIEIASSMASSNNIGTIVDSYERYKKHTNLKANLLTYSFPCQDLSSAGNYHGYNKGLEGKRSGLLLEVEKILKGSIKDGSAPKYLLMENVPNLIHENHIKSFKEWMKSLKDLGYSTYWGQLTSTDYGTFQKRKRVYAVSFKAKSPKILEILKQIVDETYLKNIKEFNDEKMSELFDLTKRKTKEKDEVVMRNTKSRNGMIRPNWYITKDDTHSRTVTKKQDRFPNVGYIDYTSNKHNKHPDYWLNKRFITTRESTKLMGFDDNDYETIRKSLEKYAKIESKKTSAWAREKVFQLSGNSIVVRMLELLFLSIEEGMYE